mgnify:CR=1 FL=1
MTVGTMAAKLEAAIIKDKGFMDYTVEVDGRPVAALVPDDEQQILRVYTTTYDKLKQPDDGQHGKPASEGKQHVLF